jgi:hypothetical protein
MKNSLEEFFILMRSGERKGWNLSDRVLPIPRGGSHCPECLSPGWKTETTSGTLLKYPVRERVAMALS